MMQENMSQHLVGNIPLDDSSNSIKFDPTLLSRLIALYDVSQQNGD